MGLAATIGTALGASWASSVNLYAAVAMIGIMHRFNGTPLPGGLEACANPWVIGIASAMYCVEFVADKIPYVDSCWDVVHTFIRVPAGAMMAMSAFGDFDPATKAIAMLLGGGIALGSHGTKGAARVLINASPEPFTNILASSGEDVAVFGVLGLVLLHPVLGGICVAGIIGVTIYLLPKIFRLLTRGLAAFRRTISRWLSRENTVGHGSPHV